jgi:DNA polymerase/3'-5' exonuclease PolX
MHGYRRAIQAVKGFDGGPLHSADQLKGIPGIGDGILRKIQELIEQGTIKRFEFIDTDEKTQII